MDPRRSFSVLDLPPDATPAQARRAYRDLVSVWHPDRHAHSPRLQKKAEDKLKEINAAYETVKAFLAARSPGRPAAHGPGPEKKNAGGGYNPAGRDRDPSPKENGKTDWRKTEAILASLKRAGEKAAAREKERIRQESRKRRQAEAEEAAKKKAGAEQARLRALRQQQKEKEKARKAERARVRSWEITEARLKQMLNRETAEGAVADVGQSQPRTNAAAAGKYILQWLAYALALTLGFSVNIIQDRYQFNVFAVVGICIVAVAACRLALGRWK